MQDPHQKKKMEDVGCVRETISPAQFQREAEEYTANELHALAKAIRLNPAVSERAIFFRYKSKSAKLAQYFFYVVGLLFIAYLVTLPAPQVAVDASNLERICFANFDTALSHKEVLIASITLRFLVWVLSLHTADLVTLNLAGPKTLFLQEAFEILTPFPLFLWTSLIIFLLPPQVCSILVNSVSELWQISVLSPIFEDLSLLLLKIPLLDGFFAYSQDWHLYVSVALIAHITIKAVSAVLRWTSKSIFAGVLGGAAIAVAAGHYVALVLLSGSLLEQLMEYPTDPAKVIIAVDEESESESDGDSE